MTVATSQLAREMGMNGTDSVLVVNAGSSSLKMQLLPLRLHVTVERIGEPAVPGQEATLDHAVAFRQALAELRSRAPEQNIVACGHRVVHGGEQFREPVLIDERVLATVTRLSRLAPLHNPPGIAGITAARAALPDVPHVAVFDTAFHSTLPAESFLTGLPWEYFEDRGIRNYGFHGTNHDHVTRQAALVLGRPRSELRMISLHLGNGASAAAVRYGESYDTSMGFTPLAGLLMGTRPGDLDPGILLHLLAEGMDAARLDQLLNRESGLKGLSGRGNDMRDIRRAAEAGDMRARQAIAVYVHRIRKAVGAEAAVMNGVDAIVFTGGVGQNDSQVRAEILHGMDWLGVSLDDRRNSNGEEIISATDSRVAVLVIPADEEGLIARQTLDVARAAGVAA